VSIKFRLPHDVLSRRRLLALLARVPVLAALVPGVRAFAARHPPGLDAHARRTVTAVVDLMLPRDDLPGGLALRIDQGLIASADDGMRRSLAEAVAWLDARARAKHAADFLALDAAAREGVLRAALVSDDDGAGAIAHTLRDRAFMLYYTDKTVMAAFPYTAPPQPEGFPDFQEAPK